MGLSCGQTELVQLLLRLENPSENSEGYGQIDIHAFDEEAFREACVYGHIEVVRLLLSLENQGRGKFPAELIERYRDVIERARQI